VQPYVAALDDDGVEEGDRMLERDGRSGGGNPARLVGGRKVALSAGGVATADLVPPRAVAF